MDAGTDDNFSVHWNNWSDSGWVLIWNDTTTDADINPPIFKKFSLPIGAENQTNLGIRFIHSSTGSEEESFIDNIKINGTAGSPVVIEVTVNDALIELGGATFTDTRCDIFVNGSTDTLYLGLDPGCRVEIGNASFTTIDVVSQNITGDLTASGEVSAGSFTLDSETLFNWDNLTNFVQGIWNSTIGNNNIWYNKGNVGIGTTNPTSELHVVGNVNVTNITADLVILSPNQCDDLPMGALCNNISHLIYQAT